jgi:hypothetical protein
MPYVKQVSRKYLSPKAEQIPQVAGELNFQITTLLQKYLDYHGESYATYNDIVGALECCKLELYRRMVAPYEDVKIIENGDVYNEHDSE